MEYDGILELAIGESRYSTDWKNRENTWSKLVDTLSRTKYTRETHEEYTKLSKELS